MCSPESDTGPGSEEGFAASRTLGLGFLRCCSCLKYENLAHAGICCKRSVSYGHSADSRGT